MTALRLLALLAVFSPLSVLADDDCQGAPREAVLAVPAPADKLVRVACTKWGHMLAPAAGWLWTKPGGISPVFFPAQMVQSSPGDSGHRDHFREIRVRELPPKEALEKWQPIGALFAAKSPADLRALEIVAVNQDKQAHILYLFNKNWGYACSPECTVNTAFLLIHRERRPVAW
ncbi:MAG: hypothetical protein AB1768_11125 [Pseudomonadota bacterium]|jgi:hypothetical protein